MVVLLKLEHEQDLFVLQKIDNLDESLSQFISDDLHKSIAKVGTNGSCKIMPVYQLPLIT